MMGFSDSAPLPHILGCIVSPLTLHRYAQALAPHPTCECEVIGDMLIEQVTKLVMSSYWIKVDP